MKATIAIAIAGCLFLAHAAAGQENTATSRLSAAIDTSASLQPGREDFAWHVLPQPDARLALVQASPRRSRDDDRDRILDIVATVDLTVLGTIIGMLTARIIHYSRETPCEYPCMRTPVPTRSYVIGGAIGGISVGYVMWAGLRRREEKRRQRERGIDPG